MADPVNPAGAERTEMTEKIQVSGRGLKTKFKGSNPDHRKSFSKGLCAPINLSGIESMIRW